MILVNLASRDLVDNDALYEQLVNGRISGYSVTGGEKSKLLKIAKLENVSMPPANAWFSDDSLEMLRKIWGK